MTTTPKKPMSPDQYEGLRQSLLHIELCLTMTEKMLKDGDKRDIHDRLRGELMGYTAAQKALLSKVRAEQERRGATQNAQNRPVAPQTDENDADHASGHSDGTATKGEAA